MSLYLNHYHRISYIFRIKSILLIPKLSTRNNEERSSTVVGKNNHRLCLAGTGVQGSWKLGSTSDSRFPVEFSKRRERQQQFSAERESAKLVIFNQPTLNLLPLCCSCCCCCDPITNKGTYLILRKAIGSLG